MGCEKEKEPSETLNVEAGPLWNILATLLYGQISELTLSAPCSAVVPSCLCSALLDKSGLVAEIKQDHQLSASCFPWTQWWQLEHGNTMCCLHILPNLYTPLSLFIHSHLWAMCIFVMYVHKKCTYSPRMLQLCLPFRSLLVCLPASFLESNLISFNCSYCFLFHVIQHSV